MLDIMEFNKALKISWILKYLSNDSKSKCKRFFDFHLTKVAESWFFSVTCHQKMPEISI